MFGAISAFKTLSDGFQLAILLALFAGFIGLTTGVYVWYKGKINTAVIVAVTKVQLDLAKQGMKLQDRAAEATWKLQDDVLIIRKQKDAEIQNLNTKYSSLIEWVRSQPKSAGDNNGISDSPRVAETTGKDSVGVVSRQDAVNLADYAKDAETIRLEVLACYQQYDLLKTALEQFKRENSSKPK
jgi:hypothetical protein